MEILFWWFKKKNVYVISQIFRWDGGVEDVDPVAYNFAQLVFNRQEQKNTTNRNHNLETLKNLSTVLHMAIILSFVNLIL